MKNEHPVFTYDPRCGVNDYRDDDGPRVGGVCTCPDGELFLVSAHHHARDAASRLRCHGGVPYALPRNPGCWVRGASGCPAPDWRLDDSRLEGWLQVRGDTTTSSTHSSTALACAAIRASEAECHSAGSSAVNTAQHWQAACLAAGCDGMNWFVTLQVACFQRCGDGWGSVRLAPTVPRSAHGHRAQDPVPSWTTGLPDTRGGRGGSVPIHNNA